MSGPFPSRYGRMCDIERQANDPYRLARIRAKADQELGAAVREIFEILETSPATTKQRREIILAEASKELASLSHLRPGKGLDYTSLIFQLKAVRAREFFRGLLARLRMRASARR